MKIALRGLVGSLFIILFTILILLITLRFEILNKSFLFGAFEKHNAYERLPALLAASIPNDPNLPIEEREGYAEIAKNISPQVVKPIIEENAGQVIDFINGETKDIIISFTLTGIGFENQSGIRWSISNIPDQNTQNSIRAVNGAGNIMIIISAVIFIILLILFFVYGKITGSFLNGKTLLFVSGIQIVIISLVIKLGILVVGKELLNGKEPAQKLLGLLSTSLFPEITTTWLLLGGMLLLFWLGMKMWYARNKLAKV